MKCLLLLLLKLSSHVRSSMLSMKLISRESIYSMTLLECPRGVVVVDGKLIENLHIAKAKKVLSIYDSIQNRK